MLPHSFAIDPATGIQETIGDGLWMPVVDPTGRSVIYWRGTLAFDPATAGWHPAQGDLYLANWASVAPPDLLPGAPSAPPATTESGGSQASTSASTSPRDGATASPTSSGTPAAASPSASAPHQNPASGLRQSAGPGGGASVASPLPSATAAELVPHLLRPGDQPEGAGPTSWDAEWDAEGLHLAIWAGDPVAVGIGRLSLLTVDPLTHTADREAPLLVATPALPGFSIDTDHLVWVTPPGQDGQGSQLMVLAWSGRDAGKVESLPVPGEGGVVVAH